MGDQRAIHTISGGPMYGGLARAKKAMLRSSRGFQHDTFHVGAYCMERPQEEIIFDEEDLSTGARGRTPSSSLCHLRSCGQLLGEESIGGHCNYPTTRPQSAEDPHPRGGDASSFIGKLSTLGHQDGEITVFNAPMQYNVIISRPSLNAFRAITSIYHQKLNFPTPEGIREERGDRSICQEYHHTTWKEEPQAWDLELWNELLTPMEVGLLQEEYYLKEPQEEEDSNAPKLKEEPKLETIEQIKLVALDPNDETRTVRLGIELEPDALK
ncbi:hypothetical protein DH2020_044278 [Rehmannia glutinosa]|uniref:Uncharacterized protein n=1 Tax=Rehmannia glutinosa TaxID=99300 RepID=A0ABR0UIZ1_REHGL